MSKAADTTNRSPRPADRSRHAPRQATSAENSTHSMAENESGRVALFSGPWRSQAPGTAFPAQLTTIAGAFPQAPGTAFAFAFAPPFSPTAFPAPPAPRSPPGDLTASRPQLAGRTTTSYRRISSSCVARTKPVCIACATSSRSKGSRWSGGRSTSRSTWSR